MCMQLAILVREMPSNALNVSWDTCSGCVDDVLGSSPTTALAWPDDSGASKVAILVCVWQFPSPLAACERRGYRKLHYSEGLRSTWVPRCVGIRCAARYIGGGAHESASQSLLTPCTETCTSSGNVFKVVFASSLWWITSFSSICTCTLARARPFLDT